MRRSARRCWPHCECLGCGATASSGEGTGWPRGGARCGQGRGGRPPGRMPLDVHPRPSQRLQEREETAHRPEQGSESGLRVWGPQGGRGSICTSLESPPPAPFPQDFVEICKREGGDPEEKGVDRLLGLGSSRCGGLGKRGQDWAVVQNCPHCSVFCSGSAGRVALSREDKEAAKLGLSVFTVNPVNPNAQDPGLGCLGRCGVGLHGCWVSLPTAVLLI